MIKIFAVVHTMYTNTFDTLYYESKKNKNIQFNFVVIPFRQNEVVFSVEDIENMMKKKNYPYILGYDSATSKYIDLYDYKPDIVLLQSPYDFQRISPLFSSYYLSKFCKVFHISYGSTMVDYDYPPYKGLLAGEDHIDKIFTESTPLAKVLDKYHPGKYVPIGYMKCDKFLHYADNPDFSFKERDSKYKYIIAWKPRWLVTQGDSNFLKYIYYFMSLFENNKDWKLIFIKHPLIKNELVQRNIFTQQAADDLFSQLENMENVKIVEDDDFLDEIFTADVFVGDYCSTILEFSLTKQPVIYTPTQVTLSSFGKKVLEGMYVVNSPYEMQCQLDALISGKDEKKEIREETVKYISDEHKDFSSIALYLLDYFQKIDFTKEYPAHPNIEDEAFQSGAKKKISRKNKLRYLIYKKINKRLVKTTNYKKKHPVLYKIWKHLDKKLKKKGVIK